MLVVAGNTSAQEKELLMRNLLAPVFSEVTRLAGSLAQEYDPMMQVRPRSSCGGVFHFFIFLLFIYLFIYLFFIFYFFLGTNKNT